MPVSEHMCEAYSPAIAFIMEQVSVHSRSESHNSVGLIYLREHPFESLLFDLLHNRLEEEKVVWNLQSRGSGFFVLTFTINEVTSTIFILFDNEFWLTGSDFGWAVVDSGIADGKPLKRMPEIADRLRCPRAKKHDILYVRRRKDYDESVEAA